MRLLISVALALVVATAAGLYVKTVMADATARFQAAVEAGR